MNKTRWLILAIAVVTVVAAVLLTNRFQPPPTYEGRYEGRSVAEWMMASVEDYPRRNPNAIHALRAMGEPAVVELAQMVADEDSKLKRQLVLLSVKFPVLQQFVSSSHWHRLFAATTLAELGPDAKSAIPALEKMAANPDSMLQRAAQAALIRIREQSLEPYIKAYQDTTSADSSRAYGLLLELGPAAKPAIPVLLGELQSTDTHIRLRALTVLGRVGAESAECVPPLMGMLDDTNKTIQRLTIGALANFGPLAKPAFSKVSALIEDADSQTRSSALHFFWRAAAREDLLPYRALIENATNDVDELAKRFAEMILNEKLNQP